MRALFVSSWLPEPQAATGFEIANRAIRQGLEAAGAELVPVGFRRPGAVPPAGPHVDLGTLALENAAASRAQKARWVARALRLGLPVGAAKLRVMSDRALAMRLMEAGPFDAVVLSSVQMPISYPRLATLAPAILVAHNVEHLSAGGNASSARSPLARWLYRREARLLERCEARLCAQAAVVHTLSRDDARQLGLEGDPRSIPLSLGTGRERLDGHGAADGSAPEFDVVMIGTWSWAPNRVGMDWFAAEVAPLLPSDLRIGVAGVFDGPPPPAPANLRFLGRVPDALRFLGSGAVVALAFLHSGRVVALATRGGTGVQLKTVETLEEGMPAVATPAALRGIGAVLPGNVRVADDAASFAAALCGLVEAVRSGEVGRLDGSAFARRQRAAMEAGLASGLALLQPGDPAEAWDGRERRRWRGAAR